MPVNPKQDGRDEKDNKRHMDVGEAPEIKRGAPHKDNEVNSHQEPKGKTFPPADLHEQMSR